MVCMQTKIDSLIALLNTSGLIYKKKKTNSTFNNWEMAKDEGQ